VRAGWWATLKATRQPGRAAVHSAVVAKTGTATGPGAGAVAGWRAPLRRGWGGGSPPGGAVVARPQTGTGRRGREGRATIAKPLRSAPSRVVGTLNARHGSCRRGRDGCAEGGRGMADGGHARKRGSGDRARQNASTRRHGASPPRNVYRPPSDSNRVCVGPVGVGGS